MTESTDEVRIGAVEKTLRIVELLALEGPLGTSALAGQLDLPKSTVHHHLSTLRANRYVVQEGDKYRLSFQFLTLGQQIRRWTHLYRIGKSEISSLAENINQPSHLLFPEHSTGIFLVTEDGKGGFPSIHDSGDQVPLHATAAGKAILAFLPEDQRTNILASTNLTALTPETVIDHEELRAEFTTIREQGYAVECNQFKIGYWSVAAPIMTNDEEVEGSVGITLHTESQDPADHKAETAESVTKTAEIIQIKSQYS